MAHARFRVGLATPADKGMLKNYLSGFVESGRDAPTVVQLQALLVAYYAGSPLYSEEDRADNIATVQEETDQNELLEIARSEGIDISAARLATLPESDHVAAPSASAASAVATADSWDEKHDPASGRKYFVNRRTGESSWTPPPPQTVALNRSAAAPAAIAAAQAATSATTANPLAAGAAAHHDDGWDETFDERSGHSFYTNRRTSESTWTPPPSTTAVTVPSASLQTPWTEMFSHEHGRPYWRNTVTSETTWTKPQ